MALEILSIVDMAMEGVCQLNGEVYQLRTESEKFHGSFIATILKIEETGKTTFVKAIISHQPVFSFPSKQQDSINTPDCKFLPYLNVRHHMPPL